MKAVAIVPARLASTRCPRKAMAPLCGIPMVGHCYHRARLAEGIAASYVATCDEEIAVYVRSVGGTPVITSATHTRATGRTAEALQHIEATTGERIDVAVMVQGDEPLTLPETIAETLVPFTDSAIEIVNVMARLRTRDEFLDHNNVKVVVNQNDDAMYFSREPIPSPWRGMDRLPMYMQTGIIAFRREALLRFNDMVETPLERLESVDMNRVIESGGRIRMIRTDAVTFGVDTPDELKAVESLLAADSTLARYRNQ